MRCFERMLRRAGLPFRCTEGFNPKPRMAFALSLALGIEGHHEVVELELQEELPLEEIVERLSRQAPVGLEILSLRRVPPSAKAQPCRATYRLPVPPERRGDLQRRIDELFAQEHCWVERTRPQPRRLDLRPYLHRIDLTPDGLDMQLSVTPQGTARPDEILNLLGLDDLRENGAVLQRTTLELTDEASECVAAMH